MRKNRLLILILALVLTFTMFTGFTYGNVIEVNSVTHTHSDTPELLASCSTCGGDGFISETKPQSCSNCGGDGDIAGNVCTPCNGSGSENITTHIPCTSCSTVKPTPTPIPTPKPTPKPTATPAPTATPIPSDKSECPICHGDKDCQACHGDYPNGECNVCGFTNICYECKGLGYVDKIIEYQVSYYYLKDSQWELLFSNTSTIVESLPLSYHNIYTRVTYDKEGTLPVNRNLKLTENTVVYCHKTISELVVTYMNNGEIHKTLVVPRAEIAETQFLINAPSSLFDGLDFIGWTLEREGNEIIKANWKPTSDMVLHAKWTENEKGFLDKIFDFIYNGIIIGAIGLGIFVVFKIISGRSGANITKNRSSNLKYKQQKDKYKTERKTSKETNKAESKVKSDEKKMKKNVKKAMNKTDTKKNFEKPVELRSTKNKKPEPTNKKAKW